MKILRTRPGYTMGALYKYINLKIEFLQISGMIIDMKILAIETSCDDTGIAIIDVKENKNSPDFTVLSNVIASQVELGKKYGGVYPMMAKREHEKNLPPTLKTALKQAKFSLKDIDLIAITNGPGLEPCLWVGVNFAKDLSKKWNIPLVPVNHIEGHILVNLLNKQSAYNPRHKSRDSVKSDKGQILFPAIMLVVSGGHTQIILVKKIGSYQILGETRDDAAGECFDKCAKILGLGYPGGPIIEKLASRVIPGLTRNPESVHKTLDSRFRGNDKIDRRPTSIQLPRPMINTKDYDFSFSGLKTAVLYADKKVKNKSAKYKIEMAKEIQQAIVDVLIKKTIKAVKDFKAKTLILGGGVSANTELRTQLSKISHVPVIFPKPELSTDNGLMIAIAGYFNRNKKRAKSDIARISADGNLRIDE